LTYHSNYIDNAESCVLVS